MRMRMVLTLALGVALAAPLLASEPRPTKSEFLVSTSAGFLFDEGRGAYYGMHYAVRKPFPGTVYGVALFDNPEDSAAPLRVETIIDPEAKDIQLQSPAVHVLTNGKLYNSQLMLYTDAEHTHLLSTHSQAVLFKVPMQLATQISVRYGVAVR